MERIHRSTFLRRITDGRRLERRIKSSIRREFRRPQGTITLRQTFRAGPMPTVPSFGPVAMSQPDLWAVAIAPPCHFPKTDIPVRPCREGSITLPARSVDAGKRVTFHPLLTGLCALRVFWTYSENARKRRFPAPRSRVNDNEATRTSGPARHSTRPFNVLSIGFRRCLGLVGPPAAGCISTGRWDTQ
jgi:hypothetical protein